MNIVKKIFLTLLCGGYFFMSSTMAFLGEDLGLDLYKQIDEGFESLEIKQYEYELTGQWETDINEVVWPILSEYWIECKLSGSGDIDNMLREWNVSLIIQKCSWENEVIPSLLVEEVTNALTYVRSTFRQRAETKSQKTYELARIGLYHDGNLENSPFDIINDLQEIDRIIFTQELEYNGVPYEKDPDDALDDFLQEDKSYLYEDPENIVEQDEIDEWEQEEIGAKDVVGLAEIIDDLDYHRYVCAPGSSLSGLDEDVFDTVIWNIEWTAWFTPNPRYFAYPDGVVSNGASWGWPFPGWWSLDGLYSSVSDPWACEWFFCIVIEFQKSNYGLSWWKSNSIESILQKAAKHLEKPANTSLTQRKQTTNNFELGAIIKDLAWTLRGFWIEVSTKPVPILDVESKNKDAVEWDLFEVKNLLTKYYKNLWLDYERRNDLGRFESTALEQKVLETAGWLSITYAEDRINKLQENKIALREKNRLVSLAVDKQIVQEDLREFADHFAELEWFIKAIEDFSISITGIITEMKKIPSRSS